MRMNKIVFGSLGLVVALLLYIPIARADETIRTTTLAFATFDSIVVPPALLAVFTSRTL